MINFSGRRILIDGQPSTVLAGEIHYFRVPLQEWQDRIDKLIETGCTCVASYIPWLWHELPDGSIDVTGATKPERDLGAFIDLCQSNGLSFLARPGPFIMAELKNEGIPFRIYREHPEIIPVGWDGTPAPTKTVDYLAPAFLAEVRHWFDAVLPVLAARVPSRGGNVIGLQLDNEIGMLAWVSNSPDLTDGLIDDLGRWCRDRYGAELTCRYPTEILHGAAWAKAVRSPDERWAAVLRVDLGLFMRDRFAAYTTALSTLAQEAGLGEIPYLINIHGTEGGNGVPLAIGISQLIKTWSGVPNVIAGSDHYLGDLSTGATTDFHFINAAITAMNDANQPLTSLEFEAGTGDYGAGLDRLLDPATVELKTRLFLAQGNRLINYYLLAGGINTPLDEPCGDGNEMISFTGERHGNAAPIGPRGERGLTFEATARTGQVVATHADWLADMDEEFDDLAMAFWPDAFMTEYHYPASESMTRIVDDLAWHRGPGPRKALWRSLLFAGYRFGAVNLQDPDSTLPTVVALSCGRHLPAAVQQRLVDHLKSGGGLLLLGLVPESDLEDQPCRILADHLGLTAGAVTRDDRSHYRTLRGHGWAEMLPGSRTGFFQEISAPDSAPLLIDVDGTVCGLELSLQVGRCVVFAAELPSTPALFAEAVRRLGSERGLDFETAVPGVIALTTVSPAGDRLIHLINPTGYPAKVRLDPAHSSGVFAQPFVVPQRSGWMLPCGLGTPLGRVLAANSEITEVAEDRLVFRTGLGETTEVVLESATELVADGAGEVRREAERVRISAPAAAGSLTIRRA